MSCSSNSKVLSVDDNDMIVRYLENGAENIVDGKVLRVLFQIRKPLL